MKNLTLLFALLFSLILSTSCEKEEMVTPVKTLEQQYPDWSDLTWVSTDGLSLETTYPRLEINIKGNEIKVVHTMTSKPSGYNGTYTKMSATNGSVNIGDSELTGTYTKNGSEITLTTKGLSKDEHTYVLKIN